MGYICRCFYENNIYLKEFDLHVTFTGNVNEFKQSYAEFFSSRGCTEQDIEYVLDLVQKEVRRRRELHEKSMHRKQLVLSHYERFHPKIFSLKESYLDHRFLQIVNYARSDSPNLNGLLAVLGMLKHAVSQVYIFPVFTKTFCQRLVEELEVFNSSDVPKGRPNTMNNFGILLDELGFDENFLDCLMRDYILPLTKILYPEYGGASLDSYKAFTVKYKMGEDLDLGYHFDNAEVTLNVCLGREFTGGNLYFGHMKQVPLKDSACTEMVHKIGYGCLHRGQQMHGALPIQSGERHNMIMWMRSSQTRNKCCPMCNRTPCLIEVSGKGDGFSPKVVSVCSTS